MHASAGKRSQAGQAGGPSWRAKISSRNHQRPDRLQPTRPWFNGQTSVLCCTLLPTLLCPAQSQLIANPAHSLSNMSLSESPETRQEDEVAILVHGTFAGDAANTGDRWWQQGSPVARQLSEKLPEHVHLAEEENVFHWSGENGERARSKAAASLLQHLRPMEEAGKSYHLVGHSHGGSVIWMALRMSMLADKPLRGLKSWTTVGTPFLHQSSRSPWHPLNLLAFVVGLAFLRPAFSGARGLIELLWDAASGSPIAITAKPDSEVGYIAVLRAPFLALADWLGVGVQRTDAGIQIGSFDPSSGQSLMNYLFLSREGWVLLLLMLLCIYVFLHLSVMSLRPVIESIRIRAEKKLQRQAFRRYGSRWLGLWSTDDEAINGLRATLDLSVSFVKRMTPGDRVFLTDNLELISRPYYWVIGPVYNHLLRPLMDGLVRGVLVRSAQGNDRPTTHVVDVRPVPDEQARNAQPLPESLQETILDESNRHAGAVAPLLRMLLASPSFTSGLETCSRQLSGKELVHTSYFSHAGVLDLISCNVAWESNKDAPSPVALPGSKSVVEWFVSFKQSIESGQSSRLANASAIAPRDAAA